MRAAILHGPEDLRVEDVPDPLPAADEVVVRIEAATTCGTTAWPAAFRVKTPALGQTAVIVPRSGAAR